MKNVLIITPVFAALAFAGSASAQTSYVATPPAFISTPSTADVAVTSSERTIGNGSSTASRAYRIGVKAYDEGKLDKAEAQFERGLLADGLDAEIMVYLIKIAEQKGETQKAESYKLAYNNYVLGR